MVIHRALFTWFILLVFFILLCLRLEGRIHWNWFLIFLPMWIYDVILTIEALFQISIRCKHEQFKSGIKNRNTLLVVLVLLKITAQIVLCLKMQYQHLYIPLYHVLVPIWILVPLLIIDLTMKLVKNSSSNY